MTTVPKLDNRWKEQGKSENEDHKVIDDEGVCVNHKVDKHKNQQKVEECKFNNTLSGKDDNDVLPDNEQLYSRS